MLTPYIFSDEAVIFFSRKYRDLDILFSVFLDNLIFLFSNKSLEISSKFRFLPNLKNLLIYLFFLSFPQQK